MTARPGIESRFGFFSVAVNVVLTVPLLLVGPVGVVAATGAGQLLGLAYLLRAARSQISPDLPNPLRSVPILESAATCAVVVAIELAIRPVVPNGGLGLLVCALPVPVGLFTYLVAILGVRRFGGVAAAMARDLASIGRRAALTRLVEQLGG